MLKMVEELTNLRFILRDFLSRNVEKRTLHCILTVFYQFGGCLSTFWLVLLLLKVSIVKKIADNVISLFI